MNGEKTGTVARRIGIHANSVRSYADRYSEFLSEKATGRKRRFSDDDILVLATVAHFRERGMGWEPIAEALRAGQRVDSVPELPTPEVEYARAAMELRPVAEVEKEASERRRVEKELAETRSLLEQALAQAEQERSEIRAQWRSEVERLNTRIIELEREKGLLEGKLTERQSSQFWLAVLVAVALIVAVAVYVLVRGGA